MTIKDIARIIVARHQLTNAEAENFVTMVVEVINEGLLRDRQVKIKGFGTFKLQAMKERSSVNVNTGEKVVIGEHDKITFTPDNVMKDIINKPFAHFETVLVDDNSPLLDAAYEEDNAEGAMEVVSEETDIEKKEAQEVVGKKEDTLIVQSEEKVEETTEEVKEELHETPGEQIAVEESVEERERDAEERETENAIIVDDDVVEEDRDEVVGENEDECGREYPRCRNVFIYYGILINLIVAVIAFALGYCANRFNWLEIDDVERKETVVQTAPQKTVAQPIQKTEVKVDVADTLQKPKKEEKVAIKDETEKSSPAPQQETPQQIKSQKQEEAQKPVQTKKQETPLSGYNDDPRVRTGAYYIMGTEKEVVVKDGQTLKSISRAYFGDGMECYIEAYNRTTTVKAGDKIKIPKLKLKKLVNKKK